MTVDGVGAPGIESDGYPVPPPRPPDDGEAWYAPEILDQRTVHPGVVTTVRERQREGELRDGTDAYSHLGSRSSR